MLHMGVKLDLPGWWTNRGWRYSRMGWWGRYFDLTRRKWQEAGKIALVLIFITLAPDQMLFLFSK